MGDLVLEFGAPVGDDEGPIGQFTRIFFDPSERVASHIVVMPDDIGVTARLVPIGALSFRPDGEISLKCSRADFLTYGDAVEYQSLPYSPTRDALLTILTENRVNGGAGLGGPVVAARDRIPAGAAWLDRGQAVLALNGRLGVIAGVVMDLDTSRLAGIVVAAGHLWSKRLTTLPIESVKELGGEVHLSNSIEQARSVAIDCD